jgi:DNA-binding NarL/FixJ family response regulator
LNFIMRILIVDDHPLFCDGLKLLLETLGSGYSVTSCTTSGAAMAHLQRDSWDLVLLDWNLGRTDVSALDVIAGVMAAAPRTRVVVVSAEVSASRVRLAVDAGAVGFVPKEASADLLIEAIRITSNGGIYLPASVLESASPSGERSPRPTALAERPQGMTLRQAYPRLTQRQLEVLVGMVRGQSNKAIARDLEIAEGTVKQHLNAVYRELGVATRTEAIYSLASQGIQVF